METIGTEIHIVKKKNLKKYKEALVEVHIIFMPSYCTQQEENLVN